MGRGNNSKYSRREVVDILVELGFSIDVNNGRPLGKGDHVVYVHYIYEELKVNVPVRKDLGENEMSDICANIVIIMKILGISTDRFKNREGVEGKLRNAARNAEKDICILFTPIVKHCLGLKDEKDIQAYMERTAKKVQEAKKKGKQTN